MEGKDGTTGRVVLLFFCEIRDFAKCLGRATSSHHTLFLFLLGCMGMLHITCEFLMSCAGMCVYVGWIPSGFLDYLCPRQGG